MGFFFEEDLTYLTHLTAVKRDLQKGKGIGPFLREKQIEWLYRRLGREPMQQPFLHAVSLSANPDPRDNPKGAVDFQIYIFTKVLEWTLGTHKAETMDRINRLRVAYPMLDLESVLRQNVTPLHFIDD